MERTGLDYGENKAVNDQQAAAPLNPPAGSRNGSQNRPGPVRPAAGIFAPSERPGEPMTAGIGGPDGPIFPPDTNRMLRALAVENPDLADYLLLLMDG